MPRTRRRDEEYDDEDDDYDDRPRRRRRDEDVTGGLIPYKNGKALAAYYCSVFSLIPCAGAVLGPLAVVLGVLGLNYAKENPNAKGQAHAIVGIVLGGITSLLNIGGPIVLVAVGVIGGIAKH